MLSPALRTIPVGHKPIVRGIIVPGVIGSDLSYDGVDLVLFLCGGQ